MEALLDVSLLALLPDALADAAGSGDGAAAWDGMGAGAAAGCEGVVSVVAWAVDASAGAGVGGALTLGVMVADAEALGADSLAVLPLLPAGAVTLLFELDACRDVFVVSFAGLLALSVAVFSGRDSIGALFFAASAVASALAVSVLASLSVAVELDATVVSARFACGFAMLAVRAGFAGPSWPTRWLSTTAPPIATAVMTPKAMPKWFTFFSNGL